MNKQMKRITLYVTEEEYNELRKKLIDCGKSASQWFREQITQFLKSK
jgi:hypothetical protein